MVCNEKAALRAVVLAPTRPRVKKLTCTRTADFLPISAVPCLSRFSTDPSGQTAWRSPIAKGVPLCSVPSITSMLIATMLTLEIDSTDAHFADTPVITPVYAQSIVSPTLRVWS